MFNNHPSKPDQTRSAAFWVIAGLVAITLSLAHADRTSVVVFLKDQPYLGIAREAKARFEPGIMAGEQAIQDIHRRHLALRSISRLDQPPAYELTPLEKTQVTQAEQTVMNRIDDLRQEIVARTEQAVRGPQQTVAQAIEALGGTVNYHYLVYNALACLVPEDRIPEIRHMALVDRVVPDFLMQGFMNTSSHSMKVDTFWQNGYTGGPNIGPWLAVVDCGIDWSHPGLSSHTHKDSTFHATASTKPNYNDNKNSTDDLQNHGTFVAGTIWSQGSWEGGADYTAYKGIAYGDDHCINAKAGYLGTDSDAWMYWSDAMAAVEWALHRAGVWANVFNLSYGDTLSHEDTDFSRFWDAVVDAEGANVTLAAGNNGPTTYKIGDPACSYNAITVGAMVDGNDTSRGTDYIASYSSRGPTASGRCKPDIVAVGGDASYGVKSCSNFWETRPDYYDWKGTSFATPQVAAAVVLLGQVFGYNPNPMVAKALLLNSCEDKGTAGWNNDFGWGYMNLWHLYCHRWDWFQYSVKPCSSRYYTGIMFPGDKATLVWDRHAKYVAGGYPTEYYTLNNLDLNVYRKSTNALLYSSTSTIDNVEQITATAYDTVVIEVKAGPTFSYGATESYALATEEGFNGLTVPHISNRLDFPTGRDHGIGTLFQVHKWIVNTCTLTVSNPACTLYCLQPSNVVISGPTPPVLPPIPPVDSIMVYWTLESSTPGVYGIAVRDSGYCCGALLKSSVADTVLIGNSATTGFDTADGGAVATCSLEVNNADNLWLVYLPLEYNTTALDCDAVIIDPTRLPAAWTVNFTINDPAGQVAITVQAPAPAGPPLPPGRHVIGFVQFSVAPGASPQVYPIDTCVIGGQSLVFLQSPTGAALPPWFRPGGVNVPNRQPPTVPTPLAPAASSLLNTRTPTFIWNRTVIGGSYILEWDKRSDFATATTLYPWDTTYTPTGPQGLADTTYYWHVAAVDPHLNRSAYSSLRSFQVDATCPPGPDLTSPLNNAVIATNPPTFQWTAVDPGKPITYALQYARDLNFTVGPVAVPGLSATSYTPLSPLAGGTYYWRVEAIDQAGNHSGFKGSPFRFGIVGSGWTKEPDVSGQPHGKPVKSGAGIAGLGGNVYLIPGNNTRDFLKFSGGTWTPLCTLPAGPKNKRVKKGAVIFADSGFVYVGKGGGTDEFCRYNALTNVWEALVASGFTKGVKAGTAAIVQMGGTRYAFVASGSNNNESKLYNLTTGTWGASSPAAMPVEKVKAGSALAYDPVGKLYFLMGSGTNNFYVADLRLPSPAWTLLQTLPLSVPGTTHRRKAKEGGAIEWFNGKVYAVKGGNTKEFWAYDPGTDNWGYAGEVGSGLPTKGIKCGRSLTSTPDGIYCLIGNNRNEFWNYATGKLFGKRFEPGNAFAQSQGLPDQFRVLFGPNPGPGTVTIRYALPRPGTATLSVFDALGRLAYMGRTDQGSFTIENLPTGVYVLRLKSADLELERKLTILR